jgi:hypothetical protein
MISALSGPTRLILREMSSRSMLGSYPRNCGDFNREYLLTCAEILFNDGHTHP